MEISEALQIIHALADGIDPFTGEQFPLESPYQHPQTVRALFKAIDALELQQQRENREKSLPANAGMPWSKAEDTKLIKAFDDGMTIKDLAERHKRTTGAIQSRLLKLGKIEPSPSQ